jgi:hypothetical protein
MIKIYCNFDKRPKTVRELLQMFFGNNNVRSLQTYHDKECTKTQCVKNKIRSIEETYFLCKTYFPNVTFKKVFYEMMSYDFNNNKLYFSYCYTIKKATVFPYHNAYSGLNLMNSLLHLLKKYNVIDNSINSLDKAKEIVGKETKNYLIKYPYV